MEPLSPKTLARKYAVLGLPKEKTDLLHVYFRSFSNLYGVISIRDAWDVFRHYEGVDAVGKEDFVAFSGIVQREPGHPFSILELEEVHSGETSVDPLARLIVNNKLIRFGYGKYALLHDTEKLQCGKKYYLPAEKKTLLSYVEDPFYLSLDGKNMVRFLSCLTTDGQYKGLDGKPRGEILDIDGNPVAGKRLPEFVFYTQNEQHDIQYFKRESKKELLRQEYRQTALDKILYRFFIHLQTGEFVRRESTSGFLIMVARIMDEDFGVSLSQEQFDAFADLFTKLNNCSHLWIHRGWRPDELSQRSRALKPKRISVSPNMKRGNGSAQI
ncbi:MAG: hypothetical protein K6B40_03685 [Firmicutes bacterium]|nr:hypothetical protein [Bacillota bacterium]